jgi:hypothetical protein
MNSHSSTLILILINMLGLTLGQFGWELETKIQIFKIDENSELMSFNVREVIPISNTVHLHLSDGTVEHSDLKLDNWFWTVDGVTDGCYKNNPGIRYEEFKFNAANCYDAGECSFKKIVIKYTRGQVDEVNTYRNKGTNKSKLKTKVSTLFKKPAWVWSDTDFDYDDVMGGKSPLTPDIGIVITVPTTLDYDEHNTGCRGIVEFKTGTTGAVNTPLAMSQANLKKVTDQFETFKTKVLKTATKGYIIVEDGTDKWILEFPDLVKYNVAKDAQFTYNVKLSALQCSDLMMGWSAKQIDLSTTEKTNCQRLILARAAQMISDIDKNSEQPYIKKFPGAGIYDFIHSEMTTVVDTNKNMISKIERGTDLGDAFLNECYKRFKKSEIAAGYCLTPYTKQGLTAFPGGTKTILVEERACTSNLCKAPFVNGDPALVLAYDCIV